MLLEIKHNAVHAGLSDQPKHSLTDSQLPPKLLLMFFPHKIWFPAIDQIMDVKEDILTKPGTISVELVSFLTLATHTPLDQAPVVPAKPNVPEQENGLRTLPRVTVPSPPKMPSRPKS